MNILNQKSRTNAMTKAILVTFIPMLLTGFGVHSFHSIFNKSNQVNQTMIENLKQQISKENIFQDSLTQSFIEIKTLLEGLINHENELLDTTKTTLEIEQEYQKIKKVERSLEDLSLIHI